MLDIRVIFIRSQEPDFTPLLERNPDVQKIVIGTSATSSNSTMIVVPELPYFDVEFRGLTDLFLWSTRGVRSLPTVPDSLRVMEVRKSLDLTEIECLPPSLERLILEDNPILEKLPPVNGRRFDQLIELSLANCVQIDAEWINELISHAPNLQRINLSGCTQLLQLPACLPSALDRIDLDKCVQLQHLPDPLPLTLRRIGLSGATQLQRLPELPRDIDYLDLSATHSLTQLPILPRLKDPGTEREKGDLRTLFLCGSGVLEPPASEHGATPTTNVSRETREYFEDVRLVGQGKVRRCKLLLLGNGSAGKTRLALNLNEHYINRPIDQGGHYAGSTHGVQFWDWPDYKARMYPQAQPQQVNLHIWDFGGQEIYHATHRLFVSRGSVFLIHWNPKQDGNQPDEKDGYQDIWYPVRYWLDYIHLECPHTVPLIAIVCTHQGKEWRQNDEKHNQKLKSSLMTRLRRDIGDEYAKRYPLYIVDSETESGIGEREKLERWLEQSVFKLIAAQGTAVPTHWQVAQDMVEEWLPRPLAVENSTSKGNLRQHARYARLTFQEFEKQFRDAVENEINTPDVATDFSRLRKNYEGGAFLTKHRLQRTLRFLTHSGWIYWKEDLDHSRVIIDQRWALDTAYSTLERKRSSIRTNLLDAKGLFTFRNLQEWCWKHEPLDETDQRLIMSFMTSIGVCFPVSRHHRHSSGDRVYLSPTHLPDSEPLTNEYDAAHPDQVQDVLESAQLHRGHWFTILRELCKRYGDNATYTKEACLIQGSTRMWNQKDEEWSALLRFCLDDVTKGLGGKIFISVAGSVVAEKLPVLKEFVQSSLPGFDGRASDAVREFDETFDTVEKEVPTVFFSYAWDPVDKVGYYEEPVNAVYDALEPFHNKRIQLLRDQKSMKEGDYISKYAQNAGAMDTKLVIVFTSEKYWLSWWCMLEFCYLLDSLMHSDKGVESSVLLIEHETGVLRNETQVRRITDKWRDAQDRLTRGELIPEGSLPTPPPRQFRRLDKIEYIKDFIHAIESTSEALTADAIGIKKRWEAGSAQDIIGWVKQKAGLPTDT